MSSGKFWKESRCSNGFQADNGCPTQRRMPTLLRLDSTGEISSARAVSTGQRPKCFKDQESLSKSGNRVSLKNLFNGFKMTKVIDSANAYIGSANAYIGSAATYLEGFCNTSSRKTLVRSDSDTTVLQNIHNMWKNQQPVTGKDRTGSFDSVLLKDNPCKPFADMNHLVSCPENNMQTTKSTTATVPNSILGVLHNTFSNCNTMKSKPEPYIPPPLKNRATRPCRNSGALFDPKLTPYNARLLARSRSQKPCVETISHKKCLKENQLDSRSLKTECLLTTPKHVDNTIDNKHSVVVRNSIGDSNCDNDSSLSDTDADPDAVNDWFDYENNNLEATPIPFDPSKRLNSLESTTATNHCSLLSDDIKPSHTPVSPSLHSWLSVDFDVDVQKAVEESFHSSQEDGSPKGCDNSKVLNLPQTLENRCPKSVYIDNNNTSQEEAKHADTISDSVCIIPSVLYVRNSHNSRQRRPSSKKRRRQKGQPSEATTTSIEEKSSCAKNQTGSVAFILGIEPDNGHSTSHPFLISCDTDSSSDWSDSDLEVDGVDGESMEDLCSFNNPLSLFNLQVMCSLEPTSPSPCSALDAINMSWRINSSVDSDDKPKSKKKPSAKKVCFVEDKCLETVHPMVTWSYAYAAARKGPWEEIARDRGRFLRRITDGEKLLKPILDANHRGKVFQERFKTNPGYNNITI